MKKEQKMALVEDLFPALLSGNKTCTIRAGKRDVETGALTFYTQGGQSATVMVTEVRHKKLAELTDAEAQKDGAATAAEMAQALKRFYPDLTPESIITIVFYDPPEKKRRPAKCAFPRPGR